MAQQRMRFSTWLLSTGTLPSCRLSVNAEPLSPRSRSFERQPDAAAVLELIEQAESLSLA
jgi:hypothetical protein